VASLASLYCLQGFFCSHCNMSPAPNQVCVSVRNTFLHFYEEGPNGACHSRYMKRSLSVGDMPIEREQSSKSIDAIGADITSLMVKNIPCRMSKEKIQDVLNEVIPDMYDTLHLPQRVTAQKKVSPVEQKKNRDSNFGYFFIMLKHPKYAKKVMEALEGKPFGPPSRSMKVVEVTMARDQMPAAGGNMFIQKSAAEPRGDRRRKFRTK